jgi:hypothetical protein
MLKSGALKIVECAHGILSAKLRILKKETEAHLNNGVS